MGPIKRGASPGYFVSELYEEKEPVKEEPVIEVIHKVRRSPDAGISCYYCDECHTIFTKVGNAGTEYCPMCMQYHADKIPKGIYNLIKAWRKLLRRDDKKAL